jgi:hypothetical protein
MRARAFAILALLAGTPAVALAWATAMHIVAKGDKGYIQCTYGVRLLPFVYLGAKHMVTGYDHLLFLAGVIFFLYRLKDIGVYVTLFALGHTITLLSGVLFDLRVNAYLVDALIGLSVAYKAAENLGLLRRWPEWVPSTKVATLVFGLWHGLGLATKILDFEMERDGMVPNLLAFNVGVELGQLLALSAILIAMNYWRRSPSFERNAAAANRALMLAGFVLAAYQLYGYSANA